MRKVRRNREFYFWDPEFCWEILRRNPTYIEACKEFVAAVNKSKDYAAGELLRSLSAYYLADALDEGPVIELSLDTNEKRRKKHARYVQNFSWEEWSENQIAKHHRLIKKARRHSTKRRFDPTIPDIFRKVFETDHLRRFQSRFGDILMFPILPNIAHIKEEMLLRVCRLSPVILSDAPADPRRGIYQFSVNIKFSDSAIIDALSFLLAEKRKKLRTQRERLFTSKTKMKWSEFELYLRAY